MVKKDKRKKALQWGETPWDMMTKEELLYEIWRYHVALESLNSVASMSRTHNPDSPYWSTEGTGGCALEMARQILEPLHALYSSEDIYRSFFRYARDLLFDVSVYDIGFRWAVCPTCGTMLGPSGGKGSLVGEQCRMPTCEGVLRQLTWDDVRPVKEEEG